MTWVPDFAHFDRSSDCHQGSEQPRLWAGLTILCLVHSAAPAASVTIEINNVGSCEK